MASPEPPGENTVFIQTHPTHPRSPNISILSTRATALDVCYSVYGEGPMSTDAVDKYYETSACE